jgi:excisionase family DNA binding protein
MGKTRQLVSLPEAHEHREWATPRYLRRLVHERRIPFHKMGTGRSARVFVDLADLDRYAEAGRVEAASDVL